MHEDISSSLITIALFSSYTGICFLLIASIFNKYGYSINDDVKFKSAFFNKDLMQKFEYSVCYNTLLSIQFDIVSYYYINLKKKNKNKNISNYINDFILFIIKNKIIEIMLYYSKFLQINKNI